MQLILANNVVGLKKYWTIATCIAHSFKKEWALFVESKCCANNQYFSKAFGIFLTTQKIFLPPGSFGASR